MLISEIVVEATGDSDFDRLMNAITNIDYVPSDDMTHIEKYRRLANIFDNRVKQLQQDKSFGDRSKIESVKKLREHLKVLALRDFFRMMAGDKKYDPRLAYYIQREYKIPPNIRKDE
jgi:hypothetical protein